MRIAILTQSSEKGINYTIAKECEFYIKKFESNSTSSIFNFDDYNLLEELDSFNAIILVIPEWNRSFPWTLKKLVDDSGYPSSFKEVPIMLIGTSKSPFGNVIGVNHINYILESLAAKVFYKKVYFQNLSYTLDPEILFLMKRNIKEFIENIK